jgi:hypothetical protein
MPINLTVAQTLTNGTRLRVDKIKPDEDARSIAYDISMRTAAAGTPQDAEIAALRAEIRGPVAPATEALSDLIARGNVPTGGRLTALLTVAAGGKVTSDAQFEAAMAAFRVSRQAFENHVRDNYLHASLAGT